MAKLDQLDWQLLHIFLTVAETGSLSAAARKLNLSQPTLGRQVRAAEKALGTSLFKREARGLALTEDGAALVEPAREIAEAVARIGLLTAGSDQETHGTVRITASVVVSHYLLPPVIARIREEAPEIQIELAPSDAAENLLFREADIALRMFRPTQLDLVARHICDLPTGLFASDSYLARKGEPQSAEDILPHDFIGFDRSEIIIRVMREMGMEVDREFFPVRCDNQTVYWELVRAGCGIGGMQLGIGEADPSVRRVLPALDLAPMPVWLAIPEPLRHVGRIRKVSDILAEEFAWIGSHPTLA